MTHHTLFSIAGSVLLLLTLSTSPVQAQEWRQEVQIITTVGYEDPIHIFVDSLSKALIRNPHIQIRREPQDTVPISFGERREELFENGLDLNSASHVFIRYGFELRDGSRIVETIESLYFIYRGNEDRADLPLLHVSAREPVVNDLIRNSGIPSLVNMESIRTFREMLAFPLLNKQTDSEMVEIAGRPMRGDESSQQRILEEFLTEQMNIGSGSYILSMPQPMMAKNPLASDSSTVHVTVLPKR